MIDCLMRPFLILKPGSSSAIARAATGPASAAAPAAAPRRSCRRLRSAMVPPVRSLARAHIVAEDELLVAKEQLSVGDHRRRPDAPCRLPERRLLRNNEPAENIAGLGRRLEERHR